MDTDNTAITDTSAPFINFSNHPSENWSEHQKKAALQLAGGQILDMPSPLVSASADEAEILKLARRCADQICSFHPAAVMCQGEFGLTYQVVTLLKDRGIRVIYSCSERKATEQQTDKGTVKTLEFCFVRFRDY